MGEDEAAPESCPSKADELICPHFSTMALLEKIQEEMLSAAKGGHSVESDILKLVVSALKNAQIAKTAGETLTEEEEIKIVFAEAKKLKDAAEQYTAAGREDLAAREKEQLTYIEKYLPEQAGEDGIRAAVVDVIKETGASGMASMGMVMGTVMQKLQGKADGKIVSDVVKELLSQQA
jgi:uncharacterized protein